MKAPSVFSWFDRAILGAIFVGIVLVGIGMILSLQAATDAASVAKVAVIVSKDIADKADRNFNATTSASESRRQADQTRGNQTVGLFLPVLLDIDEDVEQIKQKLGITSGTPNDLWYIRFNTSHLNINNQTFIFVPNFRQLLGVINASGNADVLTIRNTTADVGQ